MFKYQFREGDVKEFDDSVVDDAYDHVAKMVEHSDGSAKFGPVWHGWALREAYLRGYLADKKKDSDETED